ncbi:MAG: carboxypeptidase M32 [Pseudomonadales bacterium]|nr:carboxypeptidase M32 [Pseudomonadales bacterium]
MSYQRLHDKYREIGDLEHAQAILGWDEAVLMSPMGCTSRANSLATLSALVHRYKTASENEVLLKSAFKEKFLTEWQQANLLHIERSCRIASAVPEDLVVALSKACSECEQLWRVKRAENDWQGIYPSLTEVIQLTREKANYLADAAGMSAYDALIDLYQPGMGQAKIDPIFAELANFLPTLVDTVLEGQCAPLPFEKKIGKEKQKALALTLMRRIGFAFDRGRLDTSHHPFCGGVPDDTRITTRYNEAKFLESLMGVLHETGHALYEQGLPSDWRGQPVGEALGMAIHESQSLLMEMQVCRSREFMDFAAPIIRHELGIQEADSTIFGADNLYAHSIKVERSLIRVDADEMTYPLHVILRYEIEKQLLSGELEVKHLPELWSEKMTRYLGLSTLGNDGDGCMQDVHWYAGLIGYFPTYSLGAISAAQIFACAVKEDTHLLSDVGQGDFQPLLTWLGKHVHSKGSLVSADQLMKAVTGETLNTTAFKQHLQARYLSS